MKIRKKIMRLLFEWFCLGFVMGMVYYTIEGIWRIPQGGYANIAMLPIGGLCGIVVGGINQIPAFYNLKILWQDLIGVCIVLVIEFIAGYILNIKLGLGIWDYSHMPFNVMGQICALYGVLWFFLIPTAIWLEDWLRYKVYGELWPGCKDNKMYTWVSVYKDLFPFKKTLNY